MITWKRGEVKKLSANFSTNEFDCKCGKCTDQIIDPLLIKQLQALRDMIGVPITITSGFRCFSWNKHEGGKPDSQHLYGKAADIQTDLPAAFIRVYAAWAGFTGIGCGMNFTHVDVRDEKDRAVWSY